MDYTYNVDKTAQHLRIFNNRNGGDGACVANLTIKFGAEVFGNFGGINLRLNPLNPVIASSACSCGSTGFVVTEHTYLAAKLSLGRLEITDTDGEAGGFHAAECAKCCRPLAIDDTDITVNY